jgi:hypothetical protein
MVYDETGRHISTTITCTAASTVTYARDATHQRIRMTTTGATSNAVRYSIDDATYITPSSLKD